MAYLRGTFVHFSVDGTSLWLEKCPNFAGVHSQESLLPIVAVLLLVMSQAVLFTT